MRYLALVVAAAFLAGLSGAAWAQDDGPCTCKHIAGAHNKKDHSKEQGHEKKIPPGQAKKKGEGPHGKKPGGEGDKEAHKCGKTAGQLLDQFKKGAPPDLEKKVKDHFKFHPDGVCHCECGHKEESGKKDGHKGEDYYGKKPAGDGGKEGHKCGKTPGQFAEGLKEHKKDEADRKTKEHFKSHPEGVCHCSCGHKDSGKSEGHGEKGNNGVGNGLDPQPPGNPPVNDGPGSAPGNPGNKKR